MTYYDLTAILLFSVLSTWIIVAIDKDRRLRFVRQYKWPASVLQALQVKHPTLTTWECEVVGACLARFFLAEVRSAGSGIVLPSKLAEDLLRVFMADKPAYLCFTMRAFKDFFRLSSPFRPHVAEEERKGLERAWREACWDEHLNPEHPARLPLIFELDAYFSIPGGVRYTLVEDELFAELIVGQEETCKRTKETAPNKLFSSETGRRVVNPVDHTRSGKEPWKFMAPLSDGDICPDYSY